MSIKSKLVSTTLAVALLFGGASIGGVGVANASTNSEFTLDVVQEVLGLEVTILNAEGAYLGRLPSVETNSTTINRSIRVTNIGDVNLKVTGYADPTLKDGVEYTNQSDFDVQYIYQGQKYGSLTNGLGITNAKEFRPRLNVGESYDASMNFKVLKQLEVGQYTIPFYHIGEFAK